MQVGTIFGRYRIDGLVGRGSMGVVLRALDTVLRRPVALKLLPVELAADEAARDAFIAEMRLIASLDHPAIVPVHDAGVVDGVPYLAMRYVPGRDLGRILRDDGPLSPSQSVAVGRQVAAALDAAHRKGVLHGDVKPSNILVEGGGPQDIAYLADFGLAHARIDRSRPAGIGGSPGYLAPEVLTGGVVDGRADQYALARVLARCLAGDGRGGGPQDASDWDASLPASRIGEVLARGLAHDPLDRFPTCAALIDALSEAISISPTRTQEASATPVEPRGIEAHARLADGGPPPHRAWSRDIRQPKGRGFWTAGLAIVMAGVLLAAGLAVAQLPGPRPSPSPDPARRWEETTLMLAEAAATSAGYGPCDPRLIRGGADRRCPPTSLHCRPQRTGVQLDHGRAIAGVICRFSQDQPIFNLFLFGFGDDVAARMWWHYEVGEFGETGPDDEACEGRPGRRTFAVGVRGGVVGCWFASDKNGPLSRWWLAWHEDSSHRYGLISSVAVEGSAEDNADLGLALEELWRSLPVPLGPAPMPMASTGPSPV